MDDTARINAIGELGLCVAAHDQLTSEGWQRTWSCHYGTSVVVGATIREVIDLAILDLSVASVFSH
jgi:hypothetical protein